MASSLGRETPGAASSPLPSSPSPTFNTIVVDEMQLEPSSPVLPTHGTAPSTTTIPSKVRFNFLPSTSPFSHADFSAPEHRLSTNRNGISSSSTSRKRGHFQEPGTEDPDQQAAPDSIRSTFLQIRDLMLKACTQAETRQQQGEMLEMLEIFRQYTEKGTLPNISRIIASQVANLETATRRIESQTKALARTTPTTSQIPPSGTPSYANAANQGAKNTTSPQEWTVVGKPKPTKKDPSPKSTSMKSKRLILIRSPTGTAPEFSSFAMRNAFNKVFLDKGVKDPVVATVSKSLGQNMVITTTREFSADFLLEKRDIWEHILPFQSAQKDEPWHKVVLHGIPTADFNTLDGMDMVVDEIKTFNKGLSPIGTPYWLTTSEKRLNQRAGSVVVAFATPEEASRAIRHRLYIAGMSVRVGRYYSTASTTQCHNCQGFGHLDNYCKYATACRLCGDKHSTHQHVCNTCKAKGIRCAHLVPKCANCSEAHTADHKSCETLLAIKTKATTTLSV
jgi:hypothetical protein